MGKRAFDAMRVVFGVLLLVGPISIAKAAGWYITNCVATGTYSQEIDGNTVSAGQWLGPGNSQATVATAGDGQYLSLNSVPATYSMNEAGSEVFTVKWLNADGTSGAAPPNSLILAVTPYAAANSPAGSSVTVDDGYGDPQMSASLIQGPMGGYGNGPGYQSGYTMLNGTELPHTELIQVQATNGVATYQTRTLYADVSGFATNLMDVLGSTVVARVTVSIDNRAITLTRPGAHDEWQDPATPYITHGDTTYSYNEQDGGEGAILPIDNTQTWTPVFVGAWHKVPPVSYTWYPLNTASTWNNGLWVMPNGGQTQLLYVDDTTDGDWSKAPQPASGYMQYSATDSDNATYTGVYDINIHAMQEPLAKSVHAVFATQPAYSPDGTKLLGMIHGPAAAGAFGNNSEATGYTVGWSVGLSAGLPLEEIAQFFGDIFPGTVQGSVGYTSTTTQTVTSQAPSSPALKTGQYAYLIATAAFNRYVYDFRKFDTGGELINQLVEWPEAIAWRETTDDGPVSQPELEWKVVTGSPQVIPNQPWQATPVGQDTAMAPLLTFDPRNP